MIRRFSMAAAALLIAAGTAYADPIEGTWKTGDGSNVTIKACGGAFCIMGAEKQVGSLSPAGSGKYSGTITRAKDGKTYQGRGRISNKNTLQVTGCSGVFCLTQNWKRQ